MGNMILLGDEAFAQAAIDAGIKGAYSYPGTPATEILEYVQRANHKNGKINCHWSTNEKVAYEEALGMSFTGGRAIISMKHVGLNVAADPFMNSAMTGVEGGIVVCVADDPGMHSSQNEQDSRYYADFAKIPCFEPTNQQETYDFTREAFRLSEKVGLPAMIRLTTRLSHSRSTVNLSALENQAPLNPSVNFKNWTLLPANARVRNKRLIEMQKELVKFSDELAKKQVKYATKSGALGIITSGIGYNYLMENENLIPENTSILKINFYPLPNETIKEFASKVSEILIIEEGYPYIERQLFTLLPGVVVKLLGKIEGSLPIDGELTPDIIAEYFHKRNGTKIETKVREIPSIVAKRPPKLCKSCSHIDTYEAIKEAVLKDENTRVFSDIGCYTLGFLPPYNAIHTCVDMGASVSMAIGASHAGLHPSLAVLGDSTFLHSGITPLLDAIYQNANITIIIMDNSWVAMTGGQPSVAVNERLYEIVKGCGVNIEHIKQITPLRKNHEENVKIIKEEAYYKGLSVVISSRECIQVTKRRAKKS